MTPGPNNPDPAAEELEQAHRQALPDDSPADKSDDRISGGKPAGQGAPPSINEGDAASTDGGGGTSETD
jgi:hypothetical protein